MAPDGAALSRRRLAIGFLNWAHALDHFVILIYPTVVIELQVAYGQSYATLIALATASFVAFGLFSLPAGWLADRWSRRDMMVGFYVGCGLSLVAAAFAPSLTMLGVALFALGMFAAIYHPVGTAMILENATQRGRTLAFNGVCGNLGVALAAGITAALTAALSWRGAFLVPGVVCIATGAIYLWLVPDEGKHAAKRSGSADVALSHATAAMIFGLFVVVALSAGLVFNTISISLPKIVDERVGGGISLIEVGGLTTAVFLCGALAQITVGRLVERFPLHILFAIAAVMQFAGVVWAAYASGAVAVVRARLHDGGGLRPDHAQRPGHRPLHRRRLARPGLCGALFPDLHGVRRRRVDDRIALRPRRLRPGARRHRFHRARLSGRGPFDRADRQRRREGAAGAGGAGGIDDHSAIASFGSCLWASCLVSPVGKTGDHEGRPYR